jgi:hypothetical protein
MLAGLIIWVRKKKDLFGSDTEAIVYHASVTSVSLGSTWK